MLVHIKMLSMKHLMIHLTLILPLHLLWMQLLPVNISDPLFPRLLTTTTTSTPIQGHLILLHISTQCRTYWQQLTHRSEHPYFVMTKSIKLMHLQVKQDTPPHIGVVCSNSLQSHCNDCLLRAYDKIHGAGTLSLPLPFRQLQPGPTAISSCLTCKLLITHTDHYYYKLNLRLCANCSIIVVGINFLIFCMPLWLMVVVSFLWL